MGSSHRLLAAALALAPVALANINFTWVQPSCDHGNTTVNRCLKGQHCEGTTCVPDFNAAVVVPHLHDTAEKRWLPAGHGSLLQRERRAYGAAGSVTKDGTCGAANGGTICGNAGFGSCCSQYGWCGNTPAHCGAGCQSGACTSGTSSSSSRAGQSTTLVTVASTSSTSSVAAASSAPATKDGTCGPKNGGTVCGNWPDGNCCSRFGFCGKTDAYCGAGCQSGNCLNKQQSSSSSSSVTSSSRSNTRNNIPSTSRTRTISLTSRSSTRSSSPPTRSNSRSRSSSTGTTSLTSSSSSTRSSSSSSSTSTSSSSTTSTSASPTPSGVVTKDGSCGASNGGTICGNWPQGGCCSMYGFCGATSGHCGDGCQSGPCLGPPVVQAPGAKPAPQNANPGQFDVVGQSGVPAMHAGLLPNGKVFFLDKVESFTQLKLPNGEFAYSSEYDPVSNQAVPLSYATNSFCAGGVPLADGRFVALGGNAPLDFLDPTVTDGFKGIRYLTRSPTDASLDGQGWAEPGNKLSTARWYPSVQILPDGRVFVASGSLNGFDPNVAANNNPTYEILDRNGVSSGVSVPMDILSRSQPYYMYPFIHLLADGNLFVFTAKGSQIFNVASNASIKSLPDLAGDYRTYPNTGGSVMLPLSSASNWQPDIVICGGGPYQDITAPGDASCGRIQPLAQGASWELDSMPEGRCMVEGVLLLDGTVLFLNGAEQGAQGFGVATDPAFEALIYDPKATLGNRFTTGAASSIPRLYHSVALMLMDGTILVAGSNPVEQPVLRASQQNPFPTEFRVERYTPPYLSGNKAQLRPTALQLSAATMTPGGGTITAKFNLPNGNVKDVKVALYYNGFVTHSVHMGHRMVYCDVTGFAAGATAQTLTVTPPPNHNVLPPGYYVLYVVADGVPSVGQQVMVN